MAGHGSQLRRRPAPHLRDHAICPEAALLQHGLDASEHGTDARLDERQLRRVGAGEPHNRRTEAGKGDVREAGSLQQKALSTQPVAVALQQRERSARQARRTEDAMPDTAAMETLHSLDDWP